MLARTRDRLLLALQYRDYRTLWIANICAGAAAWGLIVARMALVFAITDSAVWTGLVTFAAMAPRFFATPILGYVADRFDRQTLLSWTYGLNLVHNLVLAILVTLGLAGPWVLVALSLLNGSLRSSQMTATQSLVPNLVPREHLLNAVALNQATQQGSRLLGPLVMIPVIAFINLEAAIWLFSVFYLVGLLLTLRITTRSRGEIDQKRSLASNRFAGFGYVYQNPLVLAIVLLAVLHCSLTMSFESLLPVISQQKLASGSIGVSALMAGVGVGALASSIFIAGVYSEVTRGRLFLLFGVASGLTYIALAASSQTGLSIAATVAMGASQAGFMTITHTIIKSIVPDGIRGRVSGIYNMHVGSTMAVANLGNGALTELFDAPMVMIATGAVFTLAVALSAGQRSLRRIYFPQPIPSPSAG